MARPMRIEYEGAAYHIISRGNRGDHIFGEDQGKEYFIKTLQNAVEKYKIDLYAYCIMGNHYHLLLTAPEGELAKAMQPMEVFSDGKRDGLGMYLQGDTNHYV
ncbi:MAG: transposase [Thermodesulfovibrionales bacterium]